MFSRVYLDYNATAPARPQAIAAFAAASGMPLNPSSVHAEGRRARSILDEARRRVAVLVDARPQDVTFTSGGTEAANLALSRVVQRGSHGVQRLLVAATEHSAVLNGHRFPRNDVEIIPVLSSGTIDLERLAATLARGPRALLALQAANNETGVLQPVREAAALVHAAGGIAFCDSVQAVGRVPCGREALPVDILALSGHKLGGLPGTGALVCRGEKVHIAEPLIRGGGQENGLRSGTENVPAIAGFGAAAAEVKVTDAVRLRALRDRFEKELLRLAPDTVVFGAEADRLPNTSCFSVPGAAAEKLMIALDLGGIAVSSGSACSSGKVGRSHVLEAMGVGHDLRQGAIRVSFGWNSTEGDGAAAVTVLEAALGRMAGRKLRSAA